MTTAQILMLASESLAYDAVVFLWVGRHGTQPVLMPRTLGQRRSRGRPPLPSWSSRPGPARSARRAPAAPRPVEG